MKIYKKEFFIIILLIAIAVIRSLYFLPKPPDYKIAVGQEVSIEGIVAAPVDIRQSSDRITVTPTNQTTNILAVVPHNTSIAKVSYGDIVRIRGSLETPENFITSTGKEFNYPRYLANQDIYYVIKNAKVEVISRGNGNRLKVRLYNLRESFMGHIGSIINPPESDLGNGLVLGTRGGFDETMRQEFISTGTIHIVALSGYNVTIVAESVMKILGLFLAQTASIIFGIIVILLFIIMAGSTSTAIRAGIMATIALFAKITGRTYDAGRALVIAGLLMVAYDPRVLNDISFQLSFLATGGVLFITPKVIKYINLVPMRFGLRELIATTIGATIAVLPLLLYSTGILSLVSLPANILILPFIPLTMLFVFLTGIFGFISPILSWPFAYVAHLLLYYILTVIHFFATLPFSSVTISTFPLILMLVFYGLIIWWVWKKEVYRKTERDKL